MKVENLCVFPIIIYYVKVVVFWLGCPSPEGAFSRTTLHSDNPKCCDSRRRQPLAPKMHLGCYLHGASRAIVYKFTHGNAQELFIRPRSSIGVIVSGPKTSTPAYYTTTGNRHPRIHDEMLTTIAVFYRFSKVFYGFYKFSIILHGFYRFYIIVHD